MSERRATAIIAAAAIVFLALAATGLSHRWVMLVAAGWALAFFLAVGYFDVPEDQPNAVQRWWRARRQRAEPNDPPVEPIQVRADPTAARARRRTRLW